MLACPGFHRLAMLTMQSSQVVELIDAPAAAFAQASPFQTGADSFLTNFVAIATPVAVILVMGLAIAAMFGRISWGAVATGTVAIGVLFGAPQIVTWVRGMFGV